LIPITNAIVLAVAINLSVAGYAKDLAAGAQTTTTQRPIKLADLLQSVEQHYPLIISAMQDLRKAEGDLLAAKGGFDPILKTSAQKTPAGEYSNQSFDAIVEQPTSLWGTRMVAGYRQGSGEFGPYDQKLKTNSGGEVRGGVEVPLLRGGSIDERRAKIGVAEKSVISVDQTLRQQRLDAARQAVTRYYDWVSAHEKLRIANSLLKLARDRDDATRHRVRRGDAAAIDQIDNERSVLQRETAVVAANRSINKASLELSIFLRTADGAPKVPSPSEYDASNFDFDVIGDQKSMILTADVVPDSAVYSYPEVRRAKALIEQTEIELQYAENLFLPKVDAEFLISQDYGSGSKDKARLEYKLGLKVELPLRLRTQNGRLGGVLANRTKLDAQLNLAKDRLRVLVNDYRQMIEASRQRADLIQKEVQLSLKVEEAERVRFRHGDSNLLMVNIREQTTADAQQRLIDAKVDFLKALAEYTLIHSSMQG